MTSRNVKQAGFMAPPSSSETENSELTGNGRRKRRRRDVNVYDAVAGRVTTTLPLDDGSSSEAAYPRRERTKLRDPTLAPDEVLFRRAGAPTRFTEKDIYHAHDQLPSGVKAMLPDGDMLQAVHQYASHFYASRYGTSGNHVDERSMDETALLAVGVLLEEAGRDVLGKRGDLVFTEGVEMDADGQRGQEEDTEPVTFLDVISSRPQKAATKRDGI